MQNPSISQISLIIQKTRKSSCVNARGISTAVYQVLLDGAPPPPGYPLARSHRGVPEVGYPQVPPGQVWWGVPKVGYPPARSDGGTQGGAPPVGLPPPSGTPPPVAVSAQELDLAWVPCLRLDLCSGTPPGVNRLKTWPSLVLRTRSVKIGTHLRSPCCNN